MPLPALLQDRLSLPPIRSPTLIVPSPPRLIARGKAGVVGAAR